MSDLPDRVSPTLRTRRGFVGLALGTMAVGLLLHRYGTALDATVRDVSGDALWAMMISWWIGALSPQTHAGVRAGLALAFCWAIEFSQRYPVPVIDEWRQTTVGHLIFGSGFDPRDLGAYAVGVLAALTLELVVRRRGRTA